MGARAVSPDLELFAGGGAEGVAGDDHHLGALARQFRGDLAERRRLARAVHADEQDDIGFRSRQRVEGRLARRQFGGDGLGQRLLDLALVGGLAEAKGAEPLDDAGRGGGAQIALDQMLFQPLQRLFGQRLLHEGRDDLIGHLFRRPGQARAQSLKPAFFGRIAHGVSLSRERFAGHARSFHPLIPADAGIQRFGFTAQPYIDQEGRKVCACSSHWVPASAGMSGK